MSPRSQRLRLRTVFPVVAALLLVGCGSDLADGGDRAGDGGAPEVSVPAAVPTPTSGQPAAAPPLVLEPDGIGVVVDTGNGSVRHLLFGEARLGPTTTALALARGAQQGRDELAECGEGPLTAVRFAGITAYFADGALAGWDSDAPELTIANGVGIGSTRHDLEAAYADLEVEESSLGVEWRAGALSGTLTADAPAATVDNLWSGRTCIAR